MKVLLDSCIAARTREIVGQVHDGSWAGDWDSDPGDEQIFRIAAAESRVLITIDKDFGKLAIVQGIMHVGLIRLVGFRAGERTGDPSASRFL